VIRWTLAIEVIHESVKVILHCAAWGRQIAVVSTARTIGTIACKVASVAADSTNNVSSEVLGLRAIVFPMADLSAVLASLVFVIAQSSVQRSKLTELVAFERVVALWDRCSLFWFISK
jgi:hypothetical protein